MKVLYEEQFVCLMIADNKFKGEQFSLVEYPHHPYALVVTAEG